MKNFILKLLNKQITVVLSILGFSMVTNQCAAQYGVPVRYYEIKGVVLSRNNEPINKIKVVSGYDTTFTDSIGNFTLNKEVPYSVDRMNIKFIDDDKKNNGHYFNKDTILFITPDKNRRISVKLESKN